MVGVVHDSEGHACHEATPEVCSQPPSEGGIGNEEGPHHEEKGLICSLHALLTLGHGLRWQLGDDPFNQWRHSLHAEDCTNAHEDNSDDWLDHHIQDAEFTRCDSEENVERNQRQDIVDEGSGDDSLTEVLLQLLGLDQQLQRNAYTCRSKSHSNCKTIWVDILAHGHGHAHACANWEECAQDSNCASLWAHFPCLFEVEVHATLEDHQTHACMSDHGENVGLQDAEVINLGFALVFRTFPKLGESFACGCHLLFIDTAVGNILTILVFVVAISVVLVIVAISVAVIVSIIMAAGVAVVRVAVVAVGQATMMASIVAGIMAVIVAVIVAGSEARVLDRFVAMAAEAEALPSGALIFAEIVMVEQVVQLVLVVAGQDGPHNSIIPALEVILVLALSVGFGHEADDRWRQGQTLVAHDCGYPLSRYTCRS